jgi:ABC-type glycerol-3-phosphate transport system substrate-binding protein
MRVLAVSAVAAALLSLAAAGADAACARPTGAAPVAPDGAKADEETMKQAHDAIQTYVNELEAYKTCLKSEVDSAPPDTPEELKLTWLAQGDAALDAANYAANQFSYALKVYKARTTPQTAPPSK